VRFFFTATLLIATAFSAVAGEPSITGLSATEQNGRVSASFKLNGAFDLEQFTQALSSGLPAGFTYHIEIFRMRPNWFDHTVGEATIEVVATYDSRTREYLLNYRRDGRLVSSESFSDIGKLRERMITIDERDLFETAGYRPYKLSVRARADVARGYLLYVMPWDVSTSWSVAKVRSVK
jgi:hypothetical protein